MEDRLKAILGYANEWLKFAEAKNAALLTFSSGLTFTLLKNPPPLAISPWFQGAYQFAVALFFLSAIVCLVSFIPQVKIPWLSSLRKTTGDENIYFYGDVAAYSPEVLLKTIYEKSGLGQDKSKMKLELDLAGQIVINSRIALKKFKHFTLAVWTTLGAVISLAVFLIGGL